MKIAGEKRRQDLGGYSEVLPATGAKTPPTGKGEVENRGWAHLRLFELPGSGKFLSDPGVSGVRSLGLSPFDPLVET